MDIQEPLLNNNHKDIEIGKISTVTEMRLGFIRKVYGILSCQLLITFFFCSLTIFEPVREFYLGSPALTWIIFILSICLIIPLICCYDVARKTPTNYILLFLWTACESYLVALCCCFYSFKIVIAAAAMTSAVVIALTVYACSTKTDFTATGGFLFVGLTLLMLLGIFSIFLPFLHTLYLVLGVGLFSMYLIYDTQMVLGKFGVSYEMDDYIIAALSIYIDIIQLFLYILELLGDKK